MATGKKVLETLDIEEIRQRDMILYYEKEIISLEKLIPKKQAQLDDYREKLADILKIDTKVFKTKYPKH